MPNDASYEWELPGLRSSFELEDDSRFLNDAPHTSEFFDVKFYPYNPKGAPSIFAAVSKKHALVCRLTDKEPHPCDVLRLIRDDDPEAYNAGCCWSKEPETGQPWLCIAGNDAKVKIYDVKAGKLAKTLVGHGAGINDLCTSPANPSIIASASEDFTVRIWSLAPEHSEQPCVCLLGGEGHSWDLLTVAFHDTGRYILSAGHDQVINLWVVPEILPQHMEAPIVVHYPHFFTSDIHNSLVDCVAFFGDLILSRACHENSIVLWRIEGFNSDDPPPSALQAPTTYDPSKQTRSAFTPVVSAARPVQYTRLLKFSTPDCNVQFFMRFRMFNVPGKHAVLAFCNTRSRIMFWDMERLTVYSDYRKALSDPDHDDAHTRPSWLKKSRKESGVAGKGTTVSHLKSYGAGDSQSVMSASPDPDGLAGQSLNRDLALWDELYDISDESNLIQPHKSLLVTAPTEQYFVGRQAAWSPEGDWCVVVGNGNRAVICQRWPERKERMPARDRKNRKSATPAV